MAKKSSILIFVIYLITFNAVNSCGSIGGGSDGQIYQNPTLTWTMSPPAAWTFPNLNAQLTSSYLPGQPLTQADAQNQATGDLMAAALEALAANSIPTANVRIVSGYQPQMISDCVKVASTMPAIPDTPAGDMFGVVESGAVTRLATVGATAIPVAMCAARTYTGVTFQQYTVQGSLTINGVTISGLQLKQVAAQIQNTLSFNYHALFTTPITYN